MATKDEGAGLLSKVVKFVKNPTTSWADLDVQEKPIPQRMREHFGPEWYSFDYRGVHFVALCSEDPSTNIGEQQLAWCVTLLETFGGIALAIGLAARFVAPMFAIQAAAICIALAPTYPWIDRGIEYPLILGFIALAFAGFASTTAHAQVRHGNSKLLLTGGVSTIDGRSSETSSLWAATGRATMPDWSIGTIKPVSSAIGTNSAGEIGPRSGCCHRISASKPLTAPVMALTIGW